MHHPVRVGRTLSAAPMCASRALFYLFHLGQSLKGNGESVSREPKNVNSNSLGWPLVGVVHVRCNEPSTVASAPQRQNEFARVAASPSWTVHADDVAHRTLGRVRQSAQRLETNAFGRRDFAAESPE